MGTAASKKKKTQKGARGGEAGAGEGMHCAPRWTTALIIVGAIVLFVGAAVLAASFAMSPLADRFLFQNPNKGAATYGPEDPRLVRLGLDGRTLALRLVPTTETAAPGAASASSPDVVVFLHGTASDAGQSAPMLQRVADQTGATVLIPEYPGFGLADDAAPSEEGAVTAALDALRAAKEESMSGTSGGEEGRVVLVGHSLGTGVAITAADQRWRRATSAGTSAKVADELVLISPFESFRAVVRQVSPFWASILPERFPTLETVSRWNTNETDGGAVAEILFPDGTTVHHGLRDKLIDASHGERISKTMRGSRWNPIPGVGHENMPVSELVASALVLPEESA